MSNKNNKELLRTLGLKDAVGIGLGAIIGAGIFVVTGIAAGVSGPAFIISLLIAGIVASFNALSSAQLAAIYPQSGGTYEYGYRLLRSEEHTSELQSRPHLVCRLLLEKKKTNNTHYSFILYC